MSGSVCDSGSGNPAGPDRRRPGHNNVEMFRKRWIPMEERYLSACEVEARSNLVIDTTK